jgi:hypothetical protein
MSSAIRTIVRKSEREGGLLTFRRYKDMVAKRRGKSLSDDEYRARMKYNWKHRKPLPQKQEERQVAAIVEGKKNTSFWQKAKNLFSRKR